jgi:hypothetical protein
MANPLLGTQLVAAVRRNGALGPNASGVFPDDDDLLAFLNEELPNCLNPMLMKPREERFVRIKAFTAETDVAEYRLPARAMWEDVRDLQVLVPGNTPPTWMSLFPIPPENAQSGWAWCWSFTGGTYPAGYYLQDDMGVLVPVPPQAYSMRWKYFRRPSQVVTTGFSTITDVALDTGTYTVTVGATAGMATGDFDVMTDAYKALEDDLPGTVASDTTLTFLASALTDEQIAALVVGNVIAQAGTAPAAQVPQDFASLLALRATYRVQHAKKDSQWKDTLLAVEGLEKKLIAAMTPRKDGLPEHAVVRNAPGLGGGWGGW